MDPKDRRTIGKAGMTFAECSEKCAAGEEKKLQKLIENLLRQRDIPFRRDRMDKKTTGTLGWPDFTFAVRCVPVVWECKTELGKLSDQQLVLLARLAKHGWRVTLIRSFGEALADLAEIERIATK